MEATKELNILDSFNFIYMTALKRCLANPEDAKDLTQAAALKILSSTSITVITPQLCEMVVEQIAIDAWRAKRNRSEILNDNFTELASTYRDKKDIAKEYEAKEKIQEARKVLTDDQFRAFELIAEGYSREEVADIMGVKLERVKRLLVAGRKNVKSMLIQ